MAMRLKKEQVQFIRGGLVVLIIYPLAYDQKLLSSIGDSSKAAVANNQQKNGYEANTTATTTPQLLDLDPGTKTLIINVGANRNPIMPKPSDGPCAISIAFEPVVPEMIRQHPQVRVVPAAVSASDGLSTMHIYNRAGVSSSLAKASTKAFWNSNARRKDGRTIVVATISMTTLLKSIPPEVEINFIKTDMQGYDFTAIQAAGHGLAEQGVKYLETETFGFDSFQYKGVYNDICRDWLPYMKTVGYEFDGARTDKGQPVEMFRDKEAADKTCADFLKSQPKRLFNSTRINVYNALWRLASINVTVGEVYKPYSYPVLPAANKNGKFHTFTDEEYFSCQK